LKPGLREALITGALNRRLANLAHAEISLEAPPLSDAEAPDRLSRHIGQL
jgi:hypothetical protein